VIDVRRYKLNPPLPLAWPRGGHILHARAISIHQQQLAELTAGDPVSTVAHELASALVEDITAGELLAALIPAELLQLHERWIDEIQINAWPPVDRLCEWLRRSVNDCPGVIADGTMAANVDDPLAYYGEPASILTPGQLVWYLGLRDAFKEFHEGRIDGSGRHRPPKTPTRMWLNKGESTEERQRWLMND
jgi:hypothetical protein